MLLQCENKTKVELAAHAVHINWYDRLRFSLPSNIPYENLSDHSISALFSNTLPYVLQFCWTIFVLAVVVSNIHFQCFHWLISLASTFVNRFSLHSITLTGKICHVLHDHFNYTLRTCNEDSCLDPSYNFLSPSTTLFIDACISCWYKLDSRRKNKIYHHMCNYISLSSTRSFTTVYYGIKLK